MHRAQNVGKVLEKVLEKVRTSSMPGGFISVPFSLCCVLFGLLVCLSVRKAARLRSHPVELRNYAIAMAFGNVFQNDLHLVTETFLCGLHHFTFGRDEKFRKVRSKWISQKPF